MSFSFRQTELSGVILIEPTIRGDDRGFFTESYRRSHFAEAGIDVDFVQENHSRSATGVLRGLHYQDERAPQAKLVRCIRGKVLDVVVDLRVGSPTFARHVAVELDDRGLRQIFVPSGFAHGFLVLEGPADVVYKCSSYWAPHAESAVRWDDPDLSIAWPNRAPQVSPKDAAAQHLADYLRNPAFPLHSS